MRDKPKSQKKPACMCNRCVKWRKYQRDRYRVLKSIKKALY